MHNLRALRIDLVKHLQTFLERERVDKVDRRRRLDAGAALARTITAGGQGATVSFQATIGQGATSFEVGGTVRAVVGGAGGNGVREGSFRTAAGGGGGGGGGGSFIDTTLTSGGVALRDSPGTANGRITYSITGQVHDERSAALTLSPSKTSIKGSTTGATSTGLDSCNTPNSINDVWSTYANNAQVAEVLTVNAVSGVNSVVLVGFIGVCLLKDTTSITQPLLPGAIVFVGIASDAPTFELDMMIETDTDGDGVGDSVDICDGRDDATIDPTQDFDGDGIPDDCERLFPADILPDGVIDGQDIAFYFFALENDGDEAFLDLDDSRTVDFFDIAVLLNGCP